MTGGNIMTGSITMTARYFLEISIIACDDVVFKK